MTTQWYLYKNGKQSGPLSWEQLAEQGKTGFIKPGDMVWTEGMKNWSRADQVKGLVTAPLSAPPGQHSVPLGGPAPSYQQRGSGSHRAAPAPGRGKGVLIALIVVLVVVLLGSGYFAASNLIFDSANGSVADGSDEVATTDNGQGSGVFDQTAADATGLWAPPLETGYLFYHELIELAGGDIEEFKEEYLTNLMANLPREDEVPYPLYPGARAFNAGRSVVDGTIELKTVHLLSADPVDLVFAFYEDQLGNWQSEKVVGYYVFWQEDTGDSSDAMSMRIPSIQIGEAYDHMLEAMPEAKAHIIVYF